MNTIRSTWLGWGVLCVAGGGAYYFAKREINADRAARHEADMKKKAQLRKMEASASFNTNPSSRLSKRPPPDSSSDAHEHKGLDHVGSPSSEASEDVAPVGHAPENAEQRMREKSKYEAAEPYRSKKGDRFS